MSFASRAAPAWITAAWRSGEIDTPARGGTTVVTAGSLFSLSSTASQHPLERGIGDGPVGRVDDDRQAVGPEPVEVPVDQLARLNGLGAGRLPAGSRQRRLDARREDPEAHRDHDPRRRDDAEVRGGPATEPPDGSDVCSEWPLISRPSSVGLTASSSIVWAPYLSAGAPAPARSRSRRPGCAGPRAAPGRRPRCPAGSDPAGRPRRCRRPRGRAGRAVRAAIARCVTMSASASRPPGRSTRAASANTAGLSAERLTTPLEMTASNEASSKGSSSMRARRKVTCSSRRRRSALASCSGVMSTPVTDPCGPHRARRPRRRPCPSRCRGPARARPGPGLARPRW